MFKFYMIFHDLSMVKNFFVIFLEFENQNLISENEIFSEKKISS